MFYDAESNIWGLSADIDKWLFEYHPEYRAKCCTEEKCKIEDLTANIAALKERIEAVKNTVGKVEDAAAEKVEEVEEKIEESL